MATRAEIERAKQERAVSKKRRAQASKKESVPTKSERIKAAQHASTKGRAVHGRTKLQADAKAGKPETGLDGSEPRTGGGPLVGRPSRKSTRGSVPGGEMASSETRAARMRIATPESRARRGK